MHRRKLATSLALASPDNPNTAMSFGIGRIGRIGKDREGSEGSGRIGKDRNVSECIGMYHDGPPSFRSSLIRQFTYAQILRGVQTFVLVTDRLEALEALEACPTKKDGQESPSYMHY